MGVEITAGLERFITFITAVGPLAGVGLEMSAQQALGFEQFLAVSLGALEAGGLVGRGPVVGQAVGGGELPGAVLLLAAEHLHLLCSPPVFLPAVATQLFQRIKLLVTLLAPGSLFQFGSLRLTTITTMTTTTTTSNFKNDEVLMSS